jgi:hypothetical protein
MQQVYSATKALYYGAADARIAATKSAGLRQRIAKLPLTGAVAKSAAAFSAKAEALEGAPPAAGGRGGRGGGGGLPAGGRGGPAPAVDTLWAASTALAALMNSMQGADVPPTAITVDQRRARDGALEYDQNRRSRGAERATESGGRAAARDRLMQETRS